MLRIGIDGRDLFRNEITGIGRYVLNLLEGIKTERAAHQYVLFLNDKNYCDLEIPSVKKVVIKEVSTLIWDQLLLPSFLKKEKIDIFFSPYFKAPLFADCKTIISILDIIPFMVKPYKSFLKTKLNRIAIGMFIQRASGIITVSQYSKREIKKYFKIPTDKIEVVYPAIGEDFMPVRDSDRLFEVKNRYRIYGDYILYVGNLKPHKNLIRLIQAFSLLPQGILSKFRLVIGGKKDENYDILCRMAAERGMVEKIIFTDFIRDEDLPALYSGATLFVFPSLYEGFGLPPLEAMACGTPVICSNTTSLPEVVGDCGILIDPGKTENITNAIESLLSSKGLREGLSLKGLQRAKGFSLENTAKKLLEAIEGVVREKRYCL